MVVVVSVEAFVFRSCDDEGIICDGIAHSQPNHYHKASLNQLINDTYSEAKRRECNVCAWRKIKDSRLEKLSTKKEN